MFRRVGDVRLPRRPARPHAVLFHPPFHLGVRLAKRVVRTTVHGNGRRTARQHCRLDAVRAGLDYAAQGRHTRKVLVIVSDGDDNASAATLEDAVAKSQASNAVIYGVALSDPASRDPKPRVLKRLAEKTGGLLFTPTTKHDLADVLLRIATEIRQTYTVGYAPSSPLDGRFRRLQVTAHAPGGKTLVVRTRDGYLAARTVRVGK